MTRFSCPQKAYAKAALAAALIVAQLGYGPDRLSGQNQPDHAIPLPRSVFFTDAFVEPINAGSSAPHHAERTVGDSPASVASADLNNDGYPDLIVDYATPTGGRLATHLANSEAFAPTTAESLDGIGRGLFPRPFLRESLIIETPIRPEILAVGDFNRDGNADVLIGRRGDRSFLIFPGLGDGTFGGPQAFPVSGQICWVTVGILHQNDSGPAIVVATTADGASAIVVYESTAAGPVLGSTLYHAPYAIADLSVGNFDGDSHPDIAFIANHRLTILHGSATTQARDSVETVAIPFAVTRFAPGGFVGNGQNSTFAVLTDGHEIALISKVTDGPSRGNQPRLPRGDLRNDVMLARRDPWRPDRPSTWVIEASTPLRESDPASTTLMPAGLFGSYGYDLALVEAASHTSVSSPPARQSLGTKLRLHRCEFLCRICVVGSWPPYPCG